MGNNRELCIRIVFRGAFGGLRYFVGMPAENRNQKDAVIHVAIGALRGALDYAESKI